MQRRSLAWRGALTVAATVAATAPLAALPRPAGAATQTVCATGTLARQRTEVDTDVAVARFDPSLGALLSVSVPTQTVHLDTDARFQNTAASSAAFSEDMHYTFTLTSPAGLPSPPALTGMVERIPTTTLAPFSGTLNFMGPSAVAEPSTGRDAAASAVRSTDPAVLAAFTGSGSLGFHLGSAIAEVFNGGGGNVQFQINTFVSAAVQVCYTYGLPRVAAAPTVSAPSAAPAVVATPLLTG